MKTSNSHWFRAISIGYIASEILTGDQKASVLGTTSRGIFLETSGKWLIFISLERFRSPLTITLNGAHAPLQHIIPGMPLLVDSRGLYFPDVNVTIVTQTSKVWLPTAAKTAPIAKSERLAKLTSCAKTILNYKPNIGLGRFLPSLLRITGTKIPNDQDLSQVHIDMLRLQKHLTDKELFPFIVVASSILGTGPGLTPSSDDFVIGLLLALNRWRGVLWPGRDLIHVNHQMVEVAYKKTTTLSANLIECATLGQGDERLINAVDYLMGESYKESEVVAELLGWGHSSGVDAFVGMAVALSV